MKRNFSWMKAQQAPAPRQAWLFGAVQTASNKAQRMTGGIVTARKATASKVRMELKTLLNRLARSQPIRPAVAGGGGSTASGRSCVTSVIPSALHQRDGAGVDGHQRRDDQADRQVDRHDHRDGLDRPPGLGYRRAGDRKEGG